MKRAVAAVAALAFSGCTSTGERCQDYLVRSVTYEAAKDLADSPTPEATAVRRIGIWAGTIPADVRSRYAATIERATVDELTRDFRKWEIAGRPADSVVAVLDAILTRGLYEPQLSWPDVIPPRPSDQAWYAEHCWEGKPR